MVSSPSLLPRYCADIFLAELYDPMTIMFFFRNKHMMCDFGTGNNNKLNWVLEDKQELIDIIETIYRGAKKGRGLVVSPKGMLNCCLIQDTELTCSRLLHQISILDGSHLLEYELRRMLNLMLEFVGGVVGDD